MGKCFLLAEAVGGLALAVCLIWNWWRLRTPGLILCLIWQVSFLLAEAVEGLSLALERVDDVEGRHGLAAGMLGIGDCSPLAKAKIRFPLGRPNQRDASTLMQLLVSLRK